MARSLSIMNGRFVAGCGALLLVLLDFTGHAETNKFLNPNPPGLRFPTDMPPPKQARPVVRTPLRSATVAEAALPIVRIGYIIPSNRSPQVNGVANLRAAIVDCRNWFRDQMDRYGHGPKSFRFETEADGVTPRVHVVAVTETDAFLRGDLWGRTIDAASRAGLSIWASGEVWLLIPEAHTMTPDGDITGGVALGASFGSGVDPGVAMIGGDGLAMLNPAYLNNDQPYAGSSIAALGPYRLVQDVSFAWFEGSTFSAVRSSYLGALAHELTHAFGLPHDFRNDANAHGNLMGNGLRGIRGAFLPARYPNDYTRLTYAVSGMLNTSRYFSITASDNVKPTLVISTSGTVTPGGGQITIRFSATDASGLSLAYLTVNDDMVAEMPLSGTNVTADFRTPYFTPGQVSKYGITVIDREGNLQRAQTLLTAANGNRAPIPYVKILPPAPVIGQTVTLDASQSSDPDHQTNTLTVEWDLDGDDIYETAPSTSKLLSVPMTLPGNRFIQARLTDPASARSVSTRFQIHTHQPPVSILRSGETRWDMLWLSKLGFSYSLQRTSILGAGWTATVNPSAIGDGGDAVFSDDLPTPLPSSMFYRLLFTPRR